MAEELSPEELRAELERIEFLKSGMGKKPKKERKYEEDALQVKCRKAFDLQYPDLAQLFFVVKNDGYKKRITAKNGSTFSPQGLRDKARGIRPGVADMLLSVPSGEYHGLYIEFKTTKGVQSDEQKIFQAKVEHFGYCYTIIRDEQTFKTTINSYLHGVQITKVPKGADGENYWRSNRPLFDELGY